MYAHILIPTDGSEFSNVAITAGAALAKALNADVTIITVVDTPEPLIVESEVVGPDRHERREIAQIEAVEILSRAKQVAEGVGVTCGTISAIDKRPYEAILEAASTHDCDLIVMASHGRSGIAALLIGSETQKVLTHTKLPVLVYRSHKS